MKNLIYSEKLKVLQNTAAANLELLLTDFGIEFSQSGSAFTFPCPIHEDSDNRHAINIYKESTKDGYPNGGWVCNTKKCHKIYTPTLIGFVRGILSSRAGKDVGFAPAIQYLCKFCGIKTLTALKIDSTEKIMSRAESAAILSTNMLPKHKPSGCYRKTFRKDRIIPAKYFIDKGFSPTVLDKYDVGFNSITNRIDVPIYSNSGKIVLGVTSRSIYDKHICGYYHDKNTKCPQTDVEKSLASKWIHSAGFYKTQYLYNYWFAYDLMNKSGKAILVESPGNVWKLVENGIENCIGCFGSSLSECQEILLSMAGIHTIYVLLDNDDAGNTGYKYIYKRYHKSYNVIKVNLFKEYNDVAESSNDYIKEKIIPQL